MLSRLFDLSGKVDVKPARDWDVVADSFEDLATRLGC